MSISHVHEVNNETAPHTYLIHLQQIVMSEQKRPKLQVEYLDSLEINTVEMHTGGEPLRIITSGYPEIKRRDDS